MRVWLIRLLPGCVVARRLFPSKPRYRGRKDKLGEGLFISLSASIKHLNP